MIYKNVNVMDMVSPGIQTGMAVEIKGSHIGKIRKQETLSVEEANKAIDLNGATLLPGFIDAHVHITSVFARDIFGLRLLFVLPQLIRQTQKNMTNTLHAGITTVRDLGGSPGVLKRLKGMVEKDPAKGPSIVTSIAFISTEKGYPENIKHMNWFERLFMGGQIVERVRTDEELLKTIERLARNGADWIKTVYSVNSMFEPGKKSNHLSLSQMKVLVEKAHALGKPTSLHHTENIGLEVALEAGIDTIEHIALDPLSDRALELVRNKQPTIIPTLKVPYDFIQLDTLEAWINEKGEKLFEPIGLQTARETVARYQGKAVANDSVVYDLDNAQKNYPQVITNARQLKEMGVRFGFGTDAGGTELSYFGRPLDEMKQLEHIGYSNQDVLEMATRVNAQILGMDDRIGTLEEGKRADMVLFEKNPLEKLEHIESVKQVWHEGVEVMSQ